jgi:CheY-like chemotaxis protein
VLVADPCRDTVQATTWLLRLWGHDVRGAGSGPEALEAARAYRPDAVLMELGLPRLDGLEVARRLRQQRAFPELLLVAVTGYADEKNRRRSQEAGFDCHLVKPVEPEVLRKLLDPGQREEERVEVRAVRQQPGNGRNGVVTQDELDRLGAQVQHQLSGRLRDFRLRRRGAGVVLTGRAGSYHAKQLAQHAVMRGTALPILGNEIEVS